MINFWRKKPEKVKFDEYVSPEEQRQRMYPFLVISVFLLSLIILGNLILKFI